MWKDETTGKGMDEMDFADGQDIRVVGKSVKL